MSSGEKEKNPPKMFLHFIRSISRVKSQKKEEIHLPLWAERKWNEKFCGISDRNSIERRRVLYVSRVEWLDPLIDINKCESDVPILNQNKCAHSGVSFPINNNNKLRDRRQARLKMKKKEREWVYTFRLEKKIVWMGMQFAKQERERGTRFATVNAKFYISIALHYSLKKIIIKSHILRTAHCSDSFWIVNLKIRC